ncbi:MAG: CDP-alcohol phosphatidyltransferase family protein [Bacteroidales bacterium]|jgi:phosphatidylglycerophosphate synthase|nr:CDP-alcohol phosphatidyltransferase family protein [Bacteroidales bacterium]
MEKVKAKDIRKVNTHFSFKDRYIMEWLISCQLSPFFSAFFVNKKITPNQVTLLMIISGMIGAILFALPCVICKAIGTIFIQLWFVFDDSDGEVARYTKQFSKYGTEMDFMAHAITHPLFILAFLASSLQLYGIERHWLYLIFLGFLASEFWSRATVGFNYRILKNNEAKKVAPESNLRQIISYIRANIWAFPNYILVFPFLYGVDMIFNTEIMLWCSILLVVYSLANNLVEAGRCLVKLCRG